MEKVEVQISGEGKIGFPEQMIFQGSLEGIQNQY